jgi:hypothetical protein
MQFGSLARIGTSLGVHLARNLRNCYSSCGAGNAIEAVSSAVGGGVISAQSHAALEAVVIDMV